MNPTNLPPFLTPTTNGEVSVSSAFAAASSSSDFADNFVAGNDTFAGAFFNDTSFRNASSNLTDRSSTRKNNKDALLMVDLYVSSGVAFLGIVSSVLNAVVWRKKFKDSGSKSRTAYIFCVISIVDALYSVFYILKYSLHSIKDGFPSTTPFFCGIDYENLRYFVLQPAKEILCSCSVWFTVVLCLERYLSIAKPLRFAALVTHRRVKQSLVVVAFVCVCLDIPLFFEYKYNDKDCSKPSKSPMRESDAYIIVYRVVIEHLLKFMVPFILMTTLNIRIILLMRQSTSRHRETTQFKKKHSTPSTDFSGVTMPLSEDASSTTLNLQATTEISSVNSAARQPLQMQNHHQRPEQLQRLSSNGCVKEDRRVSWVDLFKKARPKSMRRTPDETCPSLPRSHPQLERKSSLLYVEEQNNKLSFVSACYITLFLIFILPNVMRRAVWAAKDDWAKLGFDKNAMNVFRSISYFLDAIRPSSDFILYLVVSSQFRQTFLALFSKRV